jgi:hypothetical protein
MVKTSNTDPEVVKLKPDMVLVPSPQSRFWKRSNEIELTENSLVMAKVDGETLYRCGRIVLQFNVLRYDRDGRTHTTNKYGRQEDADSIPAIQEFVKLMVKQPVVSAVFKVEMYVRDEKGRPLRVSDFIHYLKGGDIKLREQICLGFFDLVEVDGRKINEDWDWKLDEMCGILGNARGTKRVHVLPFQHVKTKRDIEIAWMEYQKTMGYEGLVLHTEARTYKLKPEIELDAVIVAAQKNDGYRKKRVTSVRCALMTGPNTFLEIGDVSSGITHALRDELWKFKTEFLVDENDKFAYVYPLIVVNIRVNGIYTHKMLKWKLVNGKRVDLGLADSITMRHPTLEAIREDKEPTFRDVGLNQIPKDVDLS